MIDLHIMEGVRPRTNEIDRVVYVSARTPVSTAQSFVPGLICDAVRTDVTAGVGAASLSGGSGVEQLAIPMMTSIAADSPALADGVDRGGDGG